MRLLLVDDDDFLREALGEALSYEGHEIATASDGAEALAVLEHGPALDAILLDLMMPVLDGWGFVERQQANPRWAEIPVVVLTAMGTLPRPIAARAVLHKPFRIEALLEILERSEAVPATVHV
ncbi:MAG TPA: response regulator [Anaeromyxobacteraceae bacterium]|nr:response regulator [Anaeromyxobacteraceae bacterium]